MEYRWKTGWYYGTWLWKLRGYIDKFNGGVGLRRGRTNLILMLVILLTFGAYYTRTKREGRLLLFAEMKLPGEAWLEFKIESGELIQTATFRPLGLAGRLYWYTANTPGVLFNGMIKEITTSAKLHCKYTLAKPFILLIPIFIKFKVF